MEPGEEKCRAGMKADDETLEDAAKHRRECKEIRTTRTPERRRPELQIHSVYEAGWQ